MNGLEGTAITDALYLFCTVGSRPKISTEEGITRQGRLFGRNNEPGPPQIIIDEYQRDKYGRILLSVPPIWKGDKKRAAVKDRGRNNLPGPPNWKG